MGQKDLTEKILMDHNDVFADIINGLVFEGKQVIKPNDLCEAGVHSQFKADDSVYHELERDVAKQWVEGGVNILICGLENQTKIDWLRWSELQKSAPETSEEINPCDVHCSLLWRYSLE